MRLDKWLAEMTGQSRSEVKNKIKKGLVQVNDEVIRRPECKVDTEQDEVQLDGKLIAYEPFVYYMLNKPSGVITATTDREQKTVLDLLKWVKGRDISPVGRLDKDTEGLLLLTNDGEMVHQLLSPKKHVDKTYLVVIDGVLSVDDIEALEKGMDIGDEKETLPAKVESVQDCTREQLTQFSIQSEHQLQIVHLTIREGRYHQVKRMFARLGKPVRYLKRERMGALQLDPSLELGQYRTLTEQEIQSLRRSYEKK